MNPIKHHILEIIGKTGKFFSSSLMTKKIVLIGLGFASTIWFLFRVVPKPSRATYPCMKAAAPIMSSFILYVMGLTVTTFLFKKAKETFRQSKFIVTGSLLLTGLIIGIIATMQYSEPAYAFQTGAVEKPNTPMGEGKGIFPGRVVWEYNPDATRKEMTNKTNDYWTDDKNADQTIISKMLSDGIQSMTGKSTDAEAWDAIFRYYNSTHGKGDKGYTTGEKIVIKINLNGAGGPQNINSSPQVCYALIDQLVNTAGVAEADITIGDPNVSMNPVTYDKLNGTFNNLQYFNYSSADEQSSKEVFFTSDGTVSNTLPQKMIDAAYMINVPVFKKHHRAGISIACKNHFGTLASSRNGAWDYHYSLPSPEASGSAQNGNYGEYRCFVDIMGHKDLGGKTILYIVDGIWGSINWGHPCVKFRIAPFLNDWPSSLFISQDPVAIESVCLDFLRSEFDFTHPTEGKFVGEDKGPFPHFAGVDDYLHQAADPANWPADIDYDPENDGTILAGMGTHEHWNDSINKQYSRNLGLDKGIELYESKTTGVKNVSNNETNGFILNQNYPNPVKIKTAIKYTLSKDANVQLNVYNIKGQLVANLVNGNLKTGNHQSIWDATNCISGYYIYKMVVTLDHQKFELTQKMLVQ